MPSERATYRRYIGSLWHMLGIPTTNGAISTGMIATGLGDVQSETPLPQEPEERAGAVRGSGEQTLTPEEMARQEEALRQARQQFGQAHLAMTGAQAAEGRYSSVRQGVNGNDPRWRETVRNAAADADAREASGVGDSVESLPEWVINNARRQAAVAAEHGPIPVQHSEQSFVIGVGEVGEERSQLSVEETTPRTRSSAGQLTMQAVSPDSAKRWREAREQEVKDRREKNKGEGRS